MNLVFVYGTLRIGFHNNHWLNNGTFVDVARTLDMYAMYDGGIPYVSYNEKVSQIYGELYEVDHQTLLGLDLLEGHPTFYERKEVLVETLEGEIFQAWVYFNETKTKKLIESGDFAERDKEFKSRTA